MFYFNYYKLWIYTKMSWQSTNKFSTFWIFFKIFFCILLTNFAHNFLFLSRNAFNLIILSYWIVILIFIYFLRNLFGLIRSSITAIFKCFQTFFFPSKYFQIWNKCAQQQAKHVHCWAHPFLINYKTVIFIALMFSLI